MISAADLHGIIAKKKQYVTEWPIKRMTEMGKRAETLEEWKKVLWTDEIKFEILGSNRTFLRCTKKRCKNMT